ncbi:MAG: hypothetical protein LC799_10505 [Actinobacteria bacterium]|nr:hypothetical protein [Actinomycetota bacterium]
MQDTMRQRAPGSGELKAYLGRDAVSGKKRWAYRTLRGGKREAQRALAALVAEAERGSLARTKATVSGLLEEWFAHASPGFSPKGAREHAASSTATSSRSWATCRCPSSGPPTWTACTGGSVRRAAEPAPNTIRRAHDVLHRALAQGVRWGWPGVNPASSATPPRVPMPDINPPAPHELARLFALATEADVDLADYILLAAATGARRSELITLP